MSEPNVAATVIELHHGLVTHTQNAWPSVGFDLMAINSLLSPVFVAGFYYKTFKGPSLKAWMFYEHFIRRAAGLGVALKHGCSPVGRVPFVALQSTGCCSTGGRPPW